MQEYTKHITQWMLPHLHYYVFRSTARKKHLLIYMYILKLCLEIHKDQGLVYKGSNKLFENFKKILNESFKM